MATNRFANSIRNVALKNFRDTIDIAKNKAKPGQSGKPEDAKTEGASASPGSDTKTDGTEARDDNKPIENRGNQYMQPGGTSSGKQPTAITMDSNGSDDGGDEGDDGGGGKNLLEFLGGMFGFGGSEADEAADALSGYREDGVKAAQGNNDQWGTLNSYIDDRVADNSLFTEDELSQLSNAGIDSGDIDAALLMYSALGNNPYAILYGTQVYTDADGNTYETLTPEGLAAYNDDMFMLNSAPELADVWGDNYRTDRGEFDAHMNDALTTDELLQNFGTESINYMGGDADVVRALAAMTYASGADPYLDTEQTATISSAYGDNGAMALENYEAILGNAMIDAATSDLAALDERARNGEEVSAEEYAAARQLAADNLGWAVGDINDLFDNEQLTYVNEGGNTTDHRGNPVYGQYDEGVSNDWLADTQEKTWGAGDTQMPLPVRNQADNILNVYDGMGWY